jgi:hypothetical protein
MSNKLNLGCCALMIAIAIVLQSGCRDSRGLVPVNGRITFDGGPPPKSGRLSFSPTSAAEGYPRRPGQARFESSGEFEVTSYKDGDGLTPGTYRVNVICVERDPAPVPGGFEAVSYVAPGYQGQEVVVSAGSKPMELAIDVPLKKRK